MTWRSSVPAADYFREVGGRPHITTWVSLRESEALHRAAREHPRILEVGSQWGYSTVLMARTGAHVTAVDPHADHGSWGVFFQNVRSHNVLHNVAPVRDYSQRVLPGLTAGMFDMAFIDGDHDEAVAAFDCREARRLVRPGGLIAVHDYSRVAWPGVVRAVDRELAGIPHRVIETLYLATLAGVDSAP